MFVCMKHEVRPEDKEKGSFLIHPIAPVYDSDSRILILGSFPSVKSREAMFFYGHPQNRFWKTVAAVYGAPEMLTVDERRTFLLSHGIAVWDVIASCRIEGSSDASIREVSVNDLRPILETAEISQIYVNGKTAEKMYRKYTQPLTGRPCICLPSTSPANAVWSLEKLVQAWNRIRDGV